MLSTTKSLQLLFISRSHLAPIPDSTSVLNVHHRSSYSGCQAVLSKTAHFAGSLSVGFQSIITNAKCVSYPPPEVYTLLNQTALQNLTLTIPGPWTLRSSLTPSTCTLVILSSVTLRSSSNTSTTLNIGYPSSSRISLCSISGGGPWDPSPCGPAIGFWMHPGRRLSVSSTIRCIKSPKSPVAGSYSHVYCDIWG